MVKIATMADHRDNSNPRLAFTRLDLTRFRNYPELRLDLDDDQALVVLTGKNGAGKTNLLEAISYLGPDRGLRSARLQDVTQKGAQGGWAVSGLLHRQGGRLQIGCGIEILEDEGGPGRARRIIVCEGEKLSGASALADFVTMIWLTPKMDRIFQEGASERRRFFDQLATGLFPDHAAQISGFEKAMRERLKLLTEENAGKDEAWLSALERRMAEHAVALAATRLEVLALIRSHLEFAGDKTFPLPDLGLEGEIEELVSGFPALEAEEAFAAILKKGRGPDSRAGRTFRGPHKTDLLALHPDKGLIAGQCSTGEQKAMLIGILLAAVRLQVSVKERPPVVLLDEVIAHLDEQRRLALFRELETLGVQTWLTGTDEKLFTPLTGKAVFLRVKSGRLEKTS